MHPVMFVRQIRENCSPGPSDILLLLLSLLSLLLLLLSKYIIIKIYYYQNSHYYYSLLAGSIEIINNVEMQKEDKLSDKLSCI